MVEVIGRRWWLVLPLVAASCSDAPSMVDPKAPEARHIAGLWWLLFGMAALIAVAVIALVVAAMVRRPQPQETEADRERLDGRFIVLGGLVVPAVVLAVVAVGTIRTTNALLPPRGQLQIDVAANRWWWAVDYPGLGVTTANEIHVPVGQPVDITVTSDNVIHSLWVPQLNGKIDAIPGQPNHLAFTATSAGVFRGQCAEFCGIQHARMALLVIAEDPSTFSQWAAQNAAPRVRPADAAAVAGEALFTTTACAGCHTIRGTTASGVDGPDLTHVGSRRTLASNTLPNTPDDLTRWVAHTQGVKPGALMPEIPLDDQQVQQLVAYLEGLR